MTKTKKTGLGKGLGAFFGDDIVEDTMKASTGESIPVLMDEELVGKEFFIKVNQIEPNKEQPRKMFEEEQLKELANSMEKYGVLQPLLVQKKGDLYEIIAGERRWRAARLAGLKEVPVVIREYSKQEAMEIALIENVQREDLNPIEEAMAYQQLIEQFELKQEEIAARISKSRAAVTNSLRLLKLDKRVQDMLVCGTITSGHARAILAIEDGDCQYEVAVKTAQEHLSVREIEKLVKLLSKPRKEKQEMSKVDESLNIIFQNLEERLKSIMGTKVCINKKDKNKGRVEIEYYSEAELERIVELIESIK